jgi:hypothetical protein
MRCPNPTEPASLVYRFIGLHYSIIMSVYATATDLSTLPTVSDKLNVMASIHNRKLISAAIQSRQNPLKGDTIQYIYTDSKHNNPLCRVIPIENIQSLPQYDKEK